MDVGEQQQQSHCPGGTAGAVVDLELPGGVITTHCVSSVIRPGRRNSRDPLQFVKIHTADLSQKAVEQIRLAEEVKITKEKIKEVEEEWQSNLLNWKSKRRSGTNLNNNDSANGSSELLDQEGHGDEGATRKVKTFTEILSEKAKSGHRLGYNLRRYVTDDEDEDVDVDVEVSEIRMIQQSSSSRNPHRNASSGSTCEETSSSTSASSSPSLRRAGEDQVNSADITPSLLMGNSSSSNNNHQQSQGVTVTESGSSLAAASSGAGGKSMRHREEDGMSINAADISSNEFMMKNKGTPASGTNELHPAGGEGASVTSLSANQSPKPNILNGKKQLPNSASVTNHASCDSQQEKSGGGGSGAGHEEEEDAADLSDDAEKKRQLQKKNVWNYLLQQQNDGHVRIHADEVDPIDEDEEEEDEMQNDSGEMGEEQRLEQLIKFKAKLSAFENLSRPEAPPPPPPPITATTSSRVRSSSHNREASSSSSSASSSGVFPACSGINSSSNNKSMPARNSSSCSTIDPGLNSVSNQRNAAAAAVYSNQLHLPHQVRRKTSAVLIHSQPQQQQQAFHLGNKSNNNGINAMTSGSHSNDSSSGRTDVVPGGEKQELLQRMPIRKQPQANHSRSVPVNANFGDGQQNLIQHSASHSLAYEKDHPHHQLLVPGMGPQHQQVMQQPHQLQQLQQHYYVLNQDDRTGRAIVIQEPLYSNQQQVYVHHQQQQQMMNQQLNHYQNHQSYANSSNNSNNNANHLNNHNSSRGGQQQQQNHPPPQQQQQQQQQTAVYFPKPYPGSIPTNSSSSSSIIMPPKANHHHHPVRQSTMSNLMQQQQQQPEQIYENFNSNLNPATQQHRHHLPHHNQQQQHQHNRHHVSSSKQCILSVSGRKKCSSCSDELGRGCAAMVIESLSLYYHINCFRCSVCHIQLGNGTCGTDVRVRNHKLHCNSCYSNDEAGLKFSQV